MSVVTPGTQGSLLTAPGAPPLSTDINHFPKHETLVNVNGKQTVTTTFIRQEAQDYFLQQMAIVQNFYNNSGGVTYAQANTAMQTLLTWATTNYVDNTGAEQLAAYPKTVNGVLITDLGPITPFMAESLELTRKLAQGLGVFNGAAPSATQLAVWRSTAYMENAIAEVISNGNKARTGTLVWLDTETGKAPTASSTKAAWYFVESKMVSTSLQHLVEVEYVRGGYDAIYKELFTLNQAISTNSSVLKVLNKLQQVMNQKAPTAWRMQIEDLPIAVSIADPFAGQQKFDTFTKRMDDWEKANFDSDIPPRVTTDNLTEAKEAIDIMTQNLEAYGYTTVSTDRLEQLQDMLKYFIAAPSTVGTNAQPSGGIVYQLDEAGTGDVTIALNQVIADMEVILSDSSNTTTTESALQVWMEDFNTAAHTDGHHQMHLNQAIAAATSFNDLQRENMRKTMFLYEEFIKSAGALLSRITQIIEKLAGTISR
ncbi:MAG: hypothetical protein K0S07_71 [Chlamydiales bacterium]|jgi:hypothetical protein|nr:hypothetical protein [Chlamydiales bacterium]